MTITATEFKTNLGKYLDLAATEDIIITKNGKKIGRLTGDATAKLDALDSISGIISEQDFPEDYKDARLSRQ